MGSQIGKELREPVRPQAPELPKRDSTITYTVKPGEVVSVIAEAYHATTNNVSGVANPNKVRVGDTLTINTYKKQTWNDYQNARADYTKKMDKYLQDKKNYDNAKAKAANVAVVTQNINKIKEYYGNEYIVKREVDKQGKPTGYVYIKVTKTKTLNKIKNELGIDIDKNGEDNNNQTITKYNSFLKDQPMKEIGETGVKTRELQEVYPDDRAIRLPAASLNPHEPLGHAIKKWIQNL